MLLLLNKSFIPTGLAKPSRLLIWTCPVEEQVIMQFMQICHLIQHVQKYLFYPTRYLCFLLFKHMLGSKKLIVLTLHKYNIMSHTSTCLDLFINRWNQHAQLLTNHSFTVCNCMCAVSLPIYGMCAFNLLMSIKANK